LVRILLTCAVVSIAPVAHAQELTYTANHAAPACRTQQTLERWMRVARSPDSAALYDLAAEVLRNGECIIVDNGETVHGDLAGLMGTTIKVRRKGEPTEYFAYWEHFTLDQSLPRRQNKHGKR